MDSSSRDRGGELEVELRDLDLEIDRLLEKIVKLKVSKKNPSNILILQELIEDSKEIIKKCSSEIEDLNFAYKQRIKC